MYVLKTCWWYEMFTGNLVCYSMVRGGLDFVNKGNCITNCRIAHAFLFLLLLFYGPSFGNYWNSEYDSKGWMEYF